jgi:cold shock CspA family protein
MIYEGKSHCAELRVDGQLHWDDGDTWGRVQLKFEGAWSKASISKNILRWNEGEEVAIEILSCIAFRMTYVGKVYTAHLERSKLFWDDGDVWCLASDKEESAPPKLPPWLTYKRRYTKVDRNGLRSKVGEDAEKKLCSQRPSREERREETPSVVVGVRTQNAALVTAAVDAEVDCKDLQCMPRSSAKKQERTQEPPSSVRRVPSTWEDAVPGTPKQNTHDGKAPCDSQRAAAHQVASSASNGTGAVSDTACSQVQAKAKAPAPLVPISTKLYQGTVKWFRGSYGWLVSEGVAKDYPDVDVLVHKNDCNFKPKLGDEVRFRLSLNGQGNPQATSVALNIVETIDARDWFNASVSERAKMRAGMGGPKRT